MICDAAKDVGEPGLRINPIEFGGFNQGEGDCHGFAATLGTGEHPVFPAKGHWLDCPLTSIVIGHAEFGASISSPVFPSVVVSRGSGIGASECEETGRPNGQ